MRCFLSVLVHCSGSRVLEVTRSTPFSLLHGWRVAVALAGAMVTGPVTISMAVNPLLWTWDVAAPG